MNAIPGNVHKSVASVDYDPFAGAPLLRVVPTTEPQREVWLADQLGRDASLAFNESVSLRLRGALQVEALREALAALVARRDALRAAFGPDGETLCVLGNSAVALPVTDLSSNPNDLWEHQRRAVENPFALTRGPLFRAELLRMGGEDHVLLLTAHHIVCDGWSWWLIVRELGALYGQQVSGNALALPPAAAFADYALAQAAGSRSNATVLADQTYWLSRFADGAPILDLPLDRPRPVQRSFASAREDYTLDAPLVNAIRRIGAHQGASLFATLLAGFATVLARLGGHDDVVIGIPAAGQSVDDHGDVVGHCVNLLTLRCQIEPTQSFGMLLGATQNTLLDALDHQRYTYGELLKKLRVSRDPSRLPLVSVMFNIDQALAQESTVFPALSLEFSSNPRSHENFELFINAVQVQGTLRLECQFNRDLFEAATVRRWLAAYEQLLRAACESPDAAVSSLTWMTASERIELQALQPKATAFDRQCGMHMHFERQCGNTPNRIALCTSDASITYAELDEYANRIANLLRAQGAHRGTLVGLALDRGIDMVAALLGILKSGAGYVPLDPSFPVERLAYMASDAGLAALITHSTHADKFDLRGRPVLALDRLTTELATASAEATIIDDDSALPESIAYVIYTSGSTGRPKGVSVPHRAVANFIHAMRMQPGMGADDRLVAVTTLSFDIAVLELMLPLSVGAQAIIADRETSTDGNALMRLLDSQQATMMQATPATWRLLLDAGWRGDPAFTVLCGGEPLPPDLAAQLLPRCGALWNLYGPTETTVWSTSTQVQHGSDDALPDIHIGRPIANTQVWVLDVHGNACPRGVPGEICIGGDGVTLGYLHRPELTAERFIADPFTPVATVSDGLPQPLLYRTGDRGRWRNDGNLEHLGRLDFQVKVRGYRIELGEIENALLTHPAVAEVLVMAREDRPGDVRLVAYAVVHAGLTFDELSMASHLRGTLPEYMIPQHIVMLATMPRLPNNKIDRKALPAPQANSRRADSVRVAPRDALETRIAAAMAQTLGMSEIGIHEDFFASGGHSLLAAQLTSRLNRELGISLSLRSLFDGPTVAKLTQIVRQQGDANTAASRLAISRRENQRQAPLSMMQERLRLLEAFNPGQLSYNIPSAHRLSGALDLGALDRAFRQLAQRQSVLRTSLGEVAGEPVQIIHDSVEFGLLAVEDLRSLPREERERTLGRRMRAMVEQPFDNLVTAPLLRARLFRMANDEHVLFFMAHHFIWDGWSFDLLYLDIAELYAALVEQRPARLPELPVSYGDFSAWHREFLSGPEYAQQLAFWREQLGRRAAESGAPQALATDMPRRRGMSGRSDSLAVCVPLEKVNRLNTLSRSLDVTLFVTLLSAYFITLSGVSGQRDIIIGTPVRGRNQAEVEGLMGYFTNLLPLRVDVDGAASFAQIAQAVKNTLLDSLAHPDILLEDLSRELNLHGDGGGVLYHALFSFQDIRQRVVHWGNLRHERVEVFQPGATEDLGLWFVLHENGLNGGLIFNADIFHNDTARLLLDRYLRVLDALSADPAQLVAQLMRFDDGHAQLLGSSQPAAPIDASLMATAKQGDAAPVAERFSGPAIDPRTTYLIDVWSDVLGGVEVGLDDNFFDLGGNSMHAAQMAERVARDTGFRIKLLRLASQSVSQIAKDLPGGEKTAEPATSSAVAGTRIGGRLRRLFTRGARGSSA
ncbi:MAG: non-ribosomal peptide synthetase [Gammaproteobacteria bacterium HGW-Gammaproteobacteria-2]|jgi:amino acid adenylation domain-containing protein|nr:MAG: non-ribosomal peptide synthetase [Gammaproteobacteria bacterium HGW-Gammaproteobacteria-2]